MLFVCMWNIIQSVSTKDSLNYRNLIRFRTGFAGFMGGRFMVMNELETAVAEPAVGGTAARQNMEQFSGGNRTDAADFFESGQENRRRSGP